MESCRIRKNKDLCSWESETDQTHITRQLIMLADPIGTSTEINDSVPPVCICHPVQERKLLWCLLPPDKSFHHKSQPKEMYFSSSCVVFHRWSFVRVGLLKNITSSDPHPVGTRKRSGTLAVITLLNNWKSWKSQQNHMIESFKMKITIFWNFQSQRGSRAEDSQCWSPVEVVDDHTAPANPRAKQKNVHPKRG